MHCSSGGTHNEHCSAMSEKVFGREPQQPQSNVHSKEGKNQQLKNTVNLYSIGILYNSPVVYAHM